MDADIRRELDDLRRSIDLLRATKVDNDSKGAFTAASVRVKSKPKGIYYEVSVDDSGAPVVSLTEVGQKGI